MFFIFSTLWLEIGSVILIKDFFSVVLYFHILVFHQTEKRGNVKNVNDETKGQHHTTFKEQCLLPSFNGCYSNPKVNENHELPAECKVGFGTRGFLILVKVPTSCRTSGE